MSTCLSMRGVWKGYEAGVRGCSAAVSVLRGVDLDVAYGETVGIIAAPATGKSTLLMCAAGLLRADRGSVTWFGSAARRDAPRPEGIAYASDRPFPYGFLTAREALEYAAVVRDLPLRDAGARVAHALESSGLDAISHRRVDTLDASARARLAVAGALLSSPRLVVVDDLPPGCDIAAAHDVLALLHRAARDGAGIVFAGRFVARLAASDSTWPACFTRMLVLSAGTLAVASSRPQPTPARTVPPVHARVAESPRVSAPENGPH